MKVDRKRRDKNSDEGYKKIHLMKIQWGRYYSLPCQSQYLIWINVHFSSLGDGYGKRRGANRRKSCRMRSKTKKIEQPNEGKKGSFRFLKQLFCEMLWGTCSHFDYMLTCLHGQEELWFRGVVVEQWQCDQISY